jgi:flagellar biosynthesis protein FlhB
MSEKKHAPTHQRMRQARETGQVAVSQDLVKWVIFAALTEGFFAAQPLWRAWAAKWLEAAIAAASRPGRPPLEGTVESLRQAAWCVLALAGSAALLSLLATLVQTRFNVATKALSRGMDRLNPAANLKQLVSGQKLVMMLLLAPLKLGLMGVVVYLQLRSSLPDILLLYRGSLEQAWQAGMAILQAVTRSALLAMAVLALADFALQRHLVYRKLRMSLDEVRRDHKSMEGDPHAKGHRRRVGKELLNEPVQRRMAGANALVMNPTHLAVALQYEFNGDKVPLLLAKAHGAEAQQMRAEAARLRIPVIRYVRLARLLYAVGKEGGPIPRNSYKAVALLYHTVQDLLAQGSDLAHTDYEIHEPPGEELAPDAPADGTQADD